MHTVDLPNEYALVLQQINEDGEEDFATLAESLQLDRRRLLHIVHALRNKGLILINLDAQREAWLRLSSKGKRMMAYIWPESTLSPSF